MSEISYAAGNLKTQFKDLATLRDRTLSPLLEVIAEKFVHVLGHCDAGKYNITDVRYCGSGFLGATYDIVAVGKFMRLQFSKSNIYSSPPNYNVSASIFPLVDRITFECNCNDEAPAQAVKGLELFVKEQSLDELKEQAGKLLQKSQYGTYDGEICEFYSIKC